MVSVLAAEQSTLNCDVTICPIDSIFISSFGVVDEITEITGPVIVPDLIMATSPAAAAPVTRSDTRSGLPGIVALPPAAITVGTDFSDLPLTLSHQHIIHPDLGNEINTTEKS